MQTYDISFYMACRLVRGQHYFVTGRNYMGKSPRVKAIASCLSEQKLPGLAIRPVDFSEDVGGDWRALLVKALGLQEEPIAEATDSTLADVLKVFRADHPDVAYTLNNLGITCLRLGQKEKARESFKKALEINPQFTKAKTNLKSVP